MPIILSHCRGVSGKRIFRLFRFELLGEIVGNVSETVTNTVFPKDSYILIYIKKLISLFSRGWGIETTANLISQLWTWSVNHIKRWLCPATW